MKVPINPGSGGLGSIYSLTYVSIVESRLTLTSQGESHLIGTFHVTSGQEVSTALLKRHLHKSMSNLCVNTLNFLIAFKFLQNMQ